MEVLENKPLISSVSGFNWVSREFDESHLEAAKQKFNLPHIVAKLLSQRNIPLSEIENFLTPSLKNNLPDPFTLHGMEAGAARVRDAVMNGEKIYIFGDYDVDGATSSALLKRFLKSVGAEVKIYIPDRINEGYGPSPKAISKLKSEGTSVIITVDCGTSSFEALDEAKKLGMDVVVVDHHLASDKKPECAALINPNWFECTSGLQPGRSWRVYMLAIR